MTLNPTVCLPRPSRRALLVLGLLSTALAACSGPSLAVGRIVDVDVIDRDTGRAFEVHHHRGRHYVAGRPGARYAIRISNRTGERLLAVTAVDGVNIVSGQTAAWEQSGYVFAPWQSHDLSGWRKSDRQIAAFEFTSLPDSYAARTGRPLDVGVIGVAVFRERPPPVVLAPAPFPHEHGADQSGERAQNESSGLADAAPSARAPGPAGKAADERQDTARNRLGTGHGGREYSAVSRTAFERASRTPAEIVSIQYDSYANLVAAGIIPSDRYGWPRPFPGTHDRAGYVPDPPRY